MRNHPEPPGPWVFLWSNGDFYGIMGEQTFDKEAVRMKRRLVELGKDAVLVLLLLGLILLTLLSLPVESVRQSPVLSAILQPLAPLLGMEQAELAYMEVSEPVLDAAQPLAVSVSMSAGRYTARWDFAALDAAFETLGGALGEALDTAGETTPANEIQLRRALSGESVYFDYGLTLPAAVVASWLDAEAESELPDMHACVLAVEQDAVALYFLGEAVERAETALSVETLSKLLESFRPDGSAFAFEQDSTLEAYTLLPETSPAVPAASVTCPCDSRFHEALATALDFNPYGDTSYTDAAGTVYYSETGCALQISPTGEILLTSTAADRFRAAGPETAELVEEARRLVSLAAGESAGEARLYLSGITASEEETVCTFTYYLSGIAVNTGSPAARVVFSGQSVSRMEVQALQFTTTGQEILVLPVAQAAAVLPEGSALALQYQLQGDTLQAGWVPGR